MSLFSSEGLLPLNNSIIHSCLIAFFGPIYIYVCVSDLARWDRHFKGQPPLLVKLRISHTLTSSVGEPANQAYGFCH